MFPAGSTTAPVAVTVRGDRIIEPDEWFAVNLSSPVNVSIGDNQGLGTVGNDDSPGLSIADLAVTEPISGMRAVNFLVTLSPTSSGTVTVDYQTGDGTASADSDFLSASGTLTFPPGTDTQPSRSPSMPTA